MEGSFTIAAGPLLEEALKAESCPNSHDDEHHWPFNVNRQEERPDCIYCGKTKREVLAAVTAALKPKKPKTGAKPGKPARPGKRNRRVPYDQS